MYRALHSDTHLIDPVCQCKVQHRCNWSVVALAVCFRVSRKASSAKEGEAQNLSRRLGAQPTPSSINLL